MYRPRFFLFTSLLALAACDDAGSSTTDTGSPDVTAPDTTTDTDPNACATACNTPPAATCLDANTLHAYSSDGRCEAGECTYAAVDLPCALGCEGGACLGDPCSGVVCDAPPSPCHAATGVCQSGVCNYALDDGKGCDDGDTCTEGDRCSAGTCGGTAVTCTTPPPATCLDANNLGAYVATGTCEADGCSYESRSVPCPGGCANGQCNGDPCAGVVCNSPPAGCYEATGTCDDGLCQYDFDSGASCDDGNACTTGDVCSGGGCLGSAVTCNTPPAASCKDANTLLVASASGTCGAGNCTYTTSEVACSHGCANNACVGDPCANVTCNTPPATNCRDAQTLVSYAAAGQCQSGTCDYTATTTTCAFGCEANACKAPVGYRLSEVYYDSEGFPDSDAFVELYGPANGSLTGLTLVGVNGNGGGDYATVTLSGTFDGVGLFVVAHPNADPAILAVADITSSQVDFQNGPDSVQLRYGATVLDAVAYGDFAQGDVARGEGTAHPGASVGLSLARDRDYTDTNDNAADFEVAQVTPGVGPITCESECNVGGATQCDGAATVVTCSDTDGDGCREWATPFACEDGRFCDGGACVCDDDCPELGASECEGGEVRSCVSVGGCLRWSEPQSCESGTCRDAAECFDAPDLVISASRELCGTHVVDELTVQGGAKVTCATGELRIHARKIFVDPASSIDLSATSNEAGGGRYGFCADGQLNQAATAGGGGGNGTAGTAGPAIDWQYEVRYCSGGPQCYDEFCGVCAGGAAGGVRGSAYNLELSPGGRGGNGCHDWTSSSPGSYYHVCDPNEPEPQGGKGGGALELVADESINVLGTVAARGQAGQPSVAAGTSMSGSGGGAGGTILMRAPTITVAGTIDTSGGAGFAAGTRNEGCGSENVDGGAGGDGRLKVLYSQTFDLTGTVTGAVQSVSYTPPTVFSIEVDGQPAASSSVIVVDTFESVTFAWERPFAAANGFWYRLSDDPDERVTAGNGTYTADTEVTFERAAFTKAGRWYLHVISVHGPSLTIGTVSHRAAIYIADAPVVITSESHPNSNAWVPGTTLVASWLGPTTDEGAYPRYFYRLDRNSQATYTPVGWTATTGRNVLLTQDADGRAISSFGYYLHVVAEDRFGNIGSAVAHYRIQVGAAPATTTFYGYVHDAQGNPLVDADLRLEPFARAQKTQVAGYFIFEGLYVGAYTAYVKPAAGSAFVVNDISVTPDASPLTIDP